MENVNTKNETNINYVKFINLNTLLGKNKNIFFEEIFEDRYWDTSRRYFKRSCSCGKILLQETWKMKFDLFVLNVEQELFFLLDITFRKMLNLKKKKLV